MILDINTTWQSLYVTRIINEATIDGIDIITLFVLYRNRYHFHASSFTIVP